MIQEPTSPKQREVKPMVSVIMGSDSDLAIMKDACILLEEFDIPYEVTIVSAHRTPKRLYDYASKAKDRGIEVIIAAAGGAAHLPGMVASISRLPVIGVPIKSSSLDGLDSLLSIVQMPAGIPVATVAINNSKNAALLACRILALKYDYIDKKLKEYIDRLEASILEKAKVLEEKGYKEYLGLG